MTPPDNFQTLSAIAEAEGLIRAHDQPGAIARLEEAIREDIERGEGDGPPARALYIRLAALYRSFERYRDEVALLEGYLSRYPDDGQRTRFHSRLSKLHSIIGATRTSSVVPVNHKSSARPRQSRLDKRLLDHGRRLEQAGLPAPDVAVRIRERATTLMARAVAALEQTSAPTMYQAHLLKVMTEHRAALRTLMSEYGAELAKRRIPRGEIGGLVRTLGGTSFGSGVAEFAVVAAEAERWCLDAYDAAA